MKVILLSVKEQDSGMAGVSHSIQHFLLLLVGCKTSKNSLAVRSTVYQIII